MLAPSAGGAFADMEQYRERRRELRLQRGQENDQAAAVPVGAGSCSRMLVRQAAEDGRDGALPAPRRAQQHKTAAQQLASMGAENNVNGCNLGRRSPRLHGSNASALGAPTRRAQITRNSATAGLGGGLGNVGGLRDVTNAISSNRLNRKVGMRGGYVEKKVDDWKAGGASTSKFCAPPRPAGGATLADPNVAVQQLPTRPWPAHAVGADTMPEANTSRPDDFYSRLGVDRNAAEEEITNTYRAITANVEKNAEERAAAAEAYEVLRSPGKRRNYDAILRRVEAAPNPQHCQDYLEDIVSQLRENEGVFLPRPNYMESQVEINSKMRSILVDWLVEVHMKYKLRPHTLYLAVNLIDRFLSHKNVMRKRLQLVGVTAMFVAAKYEEIDPPLVQDFAYITDNAYTKEDILQMECHMLSTLAFQIMVPTAANYLDYNCHPGQADECSHEVTRYLVELSLLEIRMMRYLPSHLVAAAVLLTNELFCRQPAWPTSMEQKTGYAEDRLRECANELKAILDAQQRSMAGEEPKSPYCAQMQAVRRRYQQDQHHAVARMVFRLS